jgi:ATP-dependent Clp protease ATP-binding subunit ClpB
LAEVRTNGDLWKKAKEKAMRFDKFTIKSQELIQGAQTSASQLGHQQIEPEHLLKIMLEQEA